MDTAIRRGYNADFTGEHYEALVRELTARAGCPPAFRICETPLFLTAGLTRRLVEAAEGILGAVTSPGYLAQSARAVPPRFDVPGEDAHTTFLQIDFALVEDADGTIVPRLIELQGFPSLYGFQWLLDEVFRRAVPAIPAGHTPYFSGLDAETYPAVLRELLVGDCEPETAVLLEIDPLNQKTLIDFLVTERLTGLKTVDAAAVSERGGKLFYRNGRREVPIRRIYNRVIFDELERKGLDLSHLFGRDLDVTWVGHPNWYWRISKFSLPFLDHPACPKAWFVSDLGTLPDDLENWVLKPLFSFAGLGVEIGPTAERLRSLERPQDFILQRRVEYAPCVETPDGPTKAEVRMMYLWQDRPLLVNNLVRMTKGKMVGVDFNKDRTWIGASLAYHP